MVSLKECTVKRKCWFCGSNDFRTLYENYRIPTNAAKDVSSFKLAKCNKCGLILVNPAPCKEDLISYYPVDYYEDDHSGTQIVGKIIRDFYGSKKFDFLLSKLNSDSENQEKILEIGPGNGNNLVPFLNQGNKVFAIEPNERLANIVERLGVSVVHGFLEQAVNLPSDFDAVILSHVLEHEYEPYKMLAYCRQHMKEGGCIYVEIPTLDAPSFNVFRRYWGGLEFPFHLSLMKSNHLEEMLKQSGFSIVIRKYKSLIGDTTRSLEKIFMTKNVKNDKKWLLVILGFVYELWFIVLNVLFRKGDAVVIIAKKI